MPSERATQTHHPGTRQEPQRFALFPLRCVEGLQGRSAAAYRESAWLQRLANSEAGVRAFLANPIVSSHVCKLGPDRGPDRGYAGLSTLRRTTHLAEEPA